MSDIRVVVAPEREKALQRHHPWLFAQAIRSVHGKPRPGETVRLEDAGGRFLAWAAWSPESRIRARVWSWQEADWVDEEWFRRRIQQALDFRRNWMDAHATNAVRLIHGEADGLPGLVVDRYGNVLVMQLLSTGPEFWRDTLVKLLVELTGATVVQERSDAEVRKLEGLEPVGQTLHGTLPPELWVEEHGLRFAVDVEHGQKTGFFLDQRDNRALLRTLVAGDRVLDAFCFSGGFTCAALAGEASSVMAVDSSARAMDLARRNVEANGFSQRSVMLAEADVFSLFRELRDRGQQFDTIILDPPKFAPTHRHVERASRAYKDANLLALKLLSPGGKLMTFSCSGAVGPELFRKIVAGAAQDAGASTRIIRELSAAPDHAASLTFPEGLYLKGLLLQRVEA